MSYATTAGVLDLLATYLELKDKRNAQRATGKVDLVLTHVISDLDERIQNLDATQIRALAKAEAARP